MKEMIRWCLSSARSIDSKQNANAGSLMMSEAPSTSGCVFFRRRGRGAGGRKRKLSRSSSSSEGEGSAVVRTERKPVTQRGLVQKTADKGQTFRAKQEDSSDGDEQESVVAPSTSALSTSYASKRTKEREGPADMGATKVVEIDTAIDRDAQAAFERAKQLKEKEDDGTYKGLMSYDLAYKKAKDTPKGNASSGFVRKGPIRAPEHLRATVRWDYAPDICKDYKETGFCGFGDSCKFLHDRSDYKHGWQIERELEEGRYGHDDEDASRYEIDSDSDEDIPFKCSLCRSSFKDPVVTKCKHYFCEKCALKQYKKSTRCYACGVQTGGVFMPAKKITEKLEARKAAKAAARKELEGDDDDDSD
ncbi:unnamed protein product [Cyprideis torosa]|uniref:Uncharacterized protein n=1 Tax=Cyprideis torosa TaxID=163714 RepID=A0A7R8W488_9CRUS|nr:unnamed protein product [Cyprideis torosa]CAG0883928.1 unnamed protein product [Cyprideis torosa]